MVLSIVTQESACDCRLSMLELRILIHLGGEDGVTSNGHDGFSRLLARSLAKVFNTDPRAIVEARHRLVACGYIERRVAEVHTETGKVIHRTCYRVALVDEAAYG